uniref:Uncharacterized protein n=1 Tax=Arundo donax TaxID=35708 RepID=A0A0A9EVL4_ARUDO
MRGFSGSVISTTVSTCPTRKHMSSSRQWIGLS